MTPSAPAGLPEVKRYIAQYQPQDNAGPEVATMVLASEHDARIAGLEAQLDAAREALLGLLCEMALDYTLPRYEVWQITTGAVDAARDALKALDAASQPDIAAEGAGKTGGEQA